ncbi:MAG TPA: magnesium transporter CorA, partial [Variovorax sp.]|nr:magnesium transporter CorA [Variovorax sp.]
MRIFEISSTKVTEHQALAPLALPGACQNAFLWVSLTRDELRATLPDVQAILQSLSGTQLVDLHVSDLLNEQLPSHYDYTSDYDVLVIRRLATAPAATDGAPAPSSQPAQDALSEPPRPRGGLPALRRIDTRPIGFAVFDRVLLSIHPQGNQVRDSFADKLL